jgi:deazaflavin-dependent oxidoreductase (nitroreductase family)
MSPEKTGTPPRWLKPMNRVLMAMQRLGLGMRDLPVLTVPGRRSGQPRRTPLSVLDMDGHRYLLAGFPGADWAANARAAGVGTLRVGRTQERVRLVELDPEAAVPVLRAWPVRIPQGAKIMQDAGVVSESTPDAFEALAGRCAVFRLEAPEDGAR